MLEWPVPVGRRPWATMLAAASHESGAWKKGTTSTWS